MGRISDRSVPLIFKEECFQIIGACFEVHNELGSGFLEEVYHEALKLEFIDRSVPATSKPKLEIRYKGKILKKNYEPDFVFFSAIVLELKAAKALDDAHRAQLFNYLKATVFELGLLINFGCKRELEWERIIYK